MDTPQQPQTDANTAAQTGTQTSEGNGASATTTKKRKYPASFSRFFARTMQQAFWWLLLPLVLLMGLAWYWSQSSHSLQQALDVAQQNVDGLQFEGVKGSVLGGGSIDKLHWSDGDTSITASDVVFKWDAWQLKEKETLAIDTLRAKKLVVRTRASTKEPSSMVLPDTLGLPIDINAPHFAIEELAVYVDEAAVAGEKVEPQKNTIQNTIPPVLQLKNIAGNYQFDTQEQQHRASISNVQYERDGLQAHARVPSAVLSAQAPFPIALQVQAESAVVLADTQTMRLDVQIAGTGNVENPQLTITGKQLPSTGFAKPEMALNGTATLLPLTPAVLERANIQITKIHPRAFEPDAPAANFDADIAVQPKLKPDNPNIVTAWQVEIAANNKQAGSFDDNLLPLNRLQTTLHWQPTQPEKLQAENIRAALTTGAATGDAHINWSNPKALDWSGKLQLSDINPHKMVADAPPANINGTVLLRPASARASNHSNNRNNNSNKHALLQAELDLHNSDAGTWDAEKLPVQRVGTLLTLYPQQLVLENIQATLQSNQTNKQVQGNFSTRISKPYTWNTDLTVQGIDPSAIHSALQPAQVDGSIRVGNKPIVATQTQPNQQPNQQLNQHPTAPAPSPSTSAATYFAVDLKGQILSNNPSKNKNTTLPALSFDKIVVSGSFDNKQHIQLNNIDIAALDATATGSATVQPQPFALNTPKLTVETPGLHATLSGDIAENTGSGSFAANLKNARKLQSWLQRIYPSKGTQPSWLAALQQGALSGKGTLQAKWNGGWSNPTLDAKLVSPSIAMRDHKNNAQAQTQWQLSKTNITVNGSLKQATVQANSAVQFAKHNGSVKLQGKMGYDTTTQHAHATFNTLTTTLAVDKSTQSTDTSNAWQAKIKQPLQIAWRNQQLNIGASSAGLRAPMAKKSDKPHTVALRWDDSSWKPSTGKGWGDVQTKGSLKGLPLRWVDWVQPKTLQTAGVDSDMLFDGNWDMHTSPSLHIRANLQRSSGDVRMLFADELANELADDLDTRFEGENALPEGATIAKVKSARLRVRNQGEQFQIEADWDSENAGNVHLHATSTLQQTADGWGWAAQTPIAGTVKMQLPKIGVWSAIAPVGWRVSGGINAKATIGGTRSVPTLKGRFNSNNLQIYSVTDGLELEKGVLAGTFDGAGVQLEKLSFTNEGGGTLLGSGSVRWGQTAKNKTKNQNKGTLLDFKAQATQLQISNRPDRRIAFSGDISAKGSTEKIKVKGAFKVDHAQIILADENAPTLDDDVVVVKTNGKKNDKKSDTTTVAKSKAQQKKERAQARKKRQQAANQHKKAVQVQANVQLDMGDSFRVQGLGIDTYLRGKLDIKSDGSMPDIYGVITTHLGEFRAYGQWLEIDKGSIRFSGAYDNPTLDITALRPRTDVDVGVRVTGPAFNPKLRLISNPDMPDTDKLSWLILGREGAEGGAESALLQQAALSLLGGGGTGKSVAQRVGLDEIGINRQNGETSSVSLGKRISRKLYLSYEKSLIDSVSTLYMFYDISRRFKLRAQTGEEQAVDLIFTLRYDNIPDAVRQLRGKKAAPKAIKPSNNASTE